MLQNSRPSGEPPCRAVLVAKVVPAFIVLCGILLIAATTASEAAEWITPRIHDWGGQTEEGWSGITTSPVKSPPSTATPPARDPRAPNAPQAAAEPGNPIPRKSASIPASKAKP